MTGRKRHLVVDTMGLLLAVTVHAANVQDRDGAKLVLQKLAGRFPRLQLIWADGGYAGQLIAWVHELGGWLLEIVKRPRREQVRRPATALGGGAHLRVAGAPPAIEQRLRSAAREQ